MARVAATVCIVGLLIACAAPAPRSESPAVRDPVTLARAGEHLAAAQAWQQRAEQLPTQQRQAAMLAAAEQWLLAGRPDRAVATLDALEPADLPVSDVWRVNLLRAEIALERRNYSRADRLLAVSGQTMPEPLRERFNALKARLAAENPDSPQARIEALSAALTEPEFTPETALALLLELPLATLESLREEYAERDELSPWLDLALRARQRLLDPPMLKLALAQWRVRHAIEAGVDTELFDWIEAWKADQPWPDSIAVLLPEAGPLAAAGDALRKGILSAWMTLSIDQRPKLNFFASGPDGDTAVGAWFDARAEGSDFLIGPLARDQVDAMLELPDPGMPMILLNRPLNAAGRPQPVDPIAVLALPPEEEAELVAVRALVDLHQRALLVAPRDDFGERVANRLVETFQLGGGRVLDRIDYRIDRFDHTEQLSNLLALDRSEARIEALQQALGVEVEAVAHRRTDFDVVFLLARGGDGRQLMPQLRFLGLDDAPVYATSDVWPGGNVGEDLDGIRMPVAPWLLEHGAAAERRRLAESIFPELNTESTPGLLYGLGGDARALAPWLETLKRDPALYLAGAVGRLRLADGVRFERDLPWAVIEDGRPVALD